MDRLVYRDACPPSRPSSLSDLLLVHSMASQVKRLVSANLMRGSDSHVLLSELAQPSSLWPGMSPFTHSPSPSFNAKDILLMKAMEESLKVKATELLLKKLSSSAQWQTDATVPHYAQPSTSYRQNQKSFHHPSSLSSQFLQPHQHSLQTQLTAGRLQLGYNPLVAASKPSAETKQKMIEIMKSVGSTLRNRSDPLIDCVDFEDNGDHQILPPGKLMFPERLHLMLLEVEKDGNADIVSFYPHGRAFAVHDTRRFVDEIMPKWFKQSKWNSFARQLNLYGYTRIASGPDAGGYFHPLFLKCRPSHSRYMERVGVPGKEDRRKLRPRNIVDIDEPDFYSMKSANK